MLWLRWEEDGWGREGIMAMIDRHGGTLAGIRVDSTTAAWVAALSMARSVGN